MSFLSSSNKYIRFLSRYIISLVFFSAVLGVAASPPDLQTREVDWEDPAQGYVRAFVLDSDPGYIYILREEKTIGELYGNKSVNLEGYSIFYANSQAGCIAQFQGGKYDLPFQIDQEAILASGGERVGYIRKWLPEEFKDNSVVQFVADDITKKYHRDIDGLKKLLEQECYECGEKANRITSLESKKKTLLRECGRKETVIQKKQRECHQLNKKCKRFKQRVATQNDDTKSLAAPEDVLSSQFAQLNLGSNEENPQVKDSVSSATSTCSDSAVHSCSENGRLDAVSEKACQSIQEAKGNPGRKRHASAGVEKAQIWLGEHEVNDGRLVKRYSFSGDQKVSLDFFSKKGSLVDSDALDKGALENTNSSVQCREEEATTTIHIALIADDQENSDDEESEFFDCKTEDEFFECTCEGHEHGQEDLVNNQDGKPIELYDISSFSENNPGSLSFDGKGGKDSSLLKKKKKKKKKNRPYGTVKYNSDKNLQVSKEIDDIDDKVDFINDDSKKACTKNQGGAKASCKIKVQNPVKAAKSLCKNTIAVIGWGGCKMCRGIKTLVVAPVLKTVYCVKKGVDHVNLKLPQNSLLNQSGGTLKDIACLIFIAQAGSCFEAILAPCQEYFAPLGSGFYVGLSLSSIGVSCSLLELFNRCHLLNYNEVANSGVRFLLGVFSYWRCAEYADRALQL